MYQGLSNMSTNKYIEYFKNPFNNFSCSIIFCRWVTYFRSCNNSLKISNKRTIHAWHPFNYKKEIIVISTIVQQYLHGTSNVRKCTRQRALNMTDKRSPNKRGTKWQPHKECLTSLSPNNISIRVPFSFLLQTPLQNTLAFVVIHKRVHCWLEKRVVSQVWWQNVPYLFALINKFQLLSVRE